MLVNGIELLLFYISPSIMPCMLLLAQKKGRVLQGWGFGSTSMVRSGFCTGVRLPTYFPICILTYDTCYCTYITSNLYSTCKYPPIRPPSAERVIPDPRKWVAVQYYYHPSQSCHPTYHTYISHAARSNPQPHTHIIGGVFPTNPSVVAVPSLLWAPSI